MRFVFPLLPAALFFLSACDPPEPAVFDPSPRCGAEDLAGLVGQDAGILSQVDISGPLRVIHPGMAVTADYRPDRLNVAVDEDGIITRVWCA